MNPEENMLSRCASPRAGDTYTKGESRVTVTSVDGDTVHWNSVTRFGSGAHRCSLAEWGRLARRTVEQGCEVELA